MLPNAIYKPTPASETNPYASPQGVAASENLWEGVTLRNCSISDSRQLLSCGEMTSWKSHADILKSYQQLGIRFSTYQEMCGQIASDWAALRTSAEENAVASEYRLPQIRLLSSDGFPLTLVGIESRGDRVNEQEQKLFERQMDETSGQRWFISSAIAQAFPRCGATRIPDAFSEGIAGLMLQSFDTLAQLQMHVSRIALSPFQSAQSFIDDAPPLRNAPGRLDSDQTFPANVEVILVEELAMPLDASLQRIFFTVGFLRSVRSDRSFSVAIGRNEMAALAEFYEGSTSTNRALERGMKMAHWYNSSPASFRSLVPVLEEAIIAATVATGVIATAGAMTLGSSMIASSP